MAIFLCVLLVIAVLAVEWYLRAQLVTPLPKCARIVFFLDVDTEAELEFAVRGYRFLKKYDYLRGDFLIVPSVPSAQGMEAARILAKEDDVVIIEKESGCMRPE